MVNVLKSGCLLVFMLALAAAWTTETNAETMRTSFYDAPRAEVAAHCALPYGQRLQLTYRPTGKTVEVTVGDRGPERRLRRSLDISRQYAGLLGFIHAGVVSLEVIKLPSVTTPHPPCKK